LLLTAAGYGWAGFSWGWFLFRVVFRSVPAFIMWASALVVSAVGPLIAVLWLVAGDVAQASGFTGLAFWGLYWVITRRGGGRRRLRDGYSAAWSRIAAMVATLRQRHVPRGSRRPVPQGM
jgi:hypothetical protein